MASFLTQCPGCMTSFRVTDTQREAAEGMVRCGACLSVFSAPANRITLRNPVDPSQVPVLSPDAELENALEAAGYDVLPLETQGDDADGEQDEDEARPEDEDESADEDSASGLWLGDDGDRDVPLGDLDLDLHAYEDEDEEFEDDADDDDDDDGFDDDGLDDDGLDDDGLDDEEDALIDDDDDEDDGFIDDAADIDDALEDEEDDQHEEPAQPEPEFRIVEEYIQEPTLVDEAAYESDFDEDDEYAEHVQDEDEYEEDGDAEESSRRLAAAPLNIRSRGAVEAVDKHDLREYLAALEDDDALEPLDDYDLDALSEPVTISERQTVRRTLRFMGLLLLNLVLVAVLALQYVIANLDTLSRSQRLAPLMSRVCQVLECPLPEQSDLGSLSSQDLLVRSHPRYAGALEVSFIFRNDSPDAQPFPAIELGFSNVANELIANRLFQPADYLPPELQQLPAMPGQSTLQITLELADPGSEAVNYSIGFRAP